MIIRKAPLIVLILTLICGMSWAWEGKCIVVIDGDTIKVMNNGESEHIRLYGIDCPDYGQAYWKEAKQFTYNMVFGKYVKILPVDTDKYGRTVAWVHAGGRNLNYDLVAVGLAWHYILTAPDNPELEKLQTEAQQGTRGLWQHPRPTA
ncbi:MAG TPA: nuclease, partial [Deltaproteobacteria bacterium]|nr:nuclease [Deltaproteobacteria bacterium]